MIILFGILKLMHAKSELATFTGAITCNTEVKLLLIIHVNITVNIHTHMYVFTSFYCIEELLISVIHLTCKWKWKN